MKDDEIISSMSHVSIPPSELSSPSLSVSESAHPFQGYTETNYYMRSVLMHPICFPLLCYLNDVPRDSTNSDTVLHNYIWNTIDSVTVDRPNTDDCKKRENVFAATALDWGDDKTDFTQKLLFNINQCEKEDSLLTTSGAKAIIGDYEEKVKIGMICHKKDTDIGPSGTIGSTSTSQSSIVALFDFGLEENDDGTMWWSRQHQILKYVKLLRANADQNYKINQPVLLSVITINKTSKIDDDKIIGWSKKTELTDQDKSNTFNSNLMRAMNTSTTELPMEKIPFNVRFGVFLCIPKGKNEFRIALLWRHDTSTLRDASTQFGKILYAIQLSTKMSETSFQNEHMKPYQYLGPNCCKIGTSVCNMPTALLYFSREVNLLFE